MRQSDWRLYLRPYYARNWYLNFAKAKKGRRKDTYISFHSLNEVQKWKAFRVTVCLSSCLVTDILESKLSKNLNVYEVYEKHHNIIPRLFLNANSCVGISL